MQQLTLDQFTDGALQWAEGRAGSFRYYWPVQGGWESWLQVELAAWFLQGDATAYDIQREQYVFGDLRRVDLLVNQSFGVPASMISVELKAQSTGQPAFVGGVAADLVKIDSARVPPYAAGPGVALVAVVDAGTFAAVMALQRGGGLVFRPLYQLGDEVALLGAFYVGGAWLAP